MRYRWHYTLMIRRATTEDIDLIWHIADAAFGSSPWPKSVFEHDLASPRTAYFIGDGGFVGVTTILDEAEIVSVAVHPYYQKQGVAQNIFKHIFNMKQVTRFLLEVSAQNGGAQALYRKLGFTEYYRREKYYRNGDDAIMMEKKID